MLISLMIGGPLDANVLGLLLTVLAVGAALELLTGQVTAPSTTETALTMNLGNSLTVRHVPDPTKRILLLSMWADNQGAGIARLRSPRLHDNVEGISSMVVASMVSPLLPWGFQQKLFSQDTLTALLSGSATAGDIETLCMLLYYEDLAGANGRFITHEALMRGGVNVMSSNNTLALGTAGNYSGEEAINAEDDQWRANTDYALVGYNVSAECACVRWRGVDFGNLGLGGPGNDELKEMTANWFVNLAKATGLPLIPVFNAANKQAVLIDGCQDENGVDVTVTSHWVQLAERVA